MDLIHESAYVSTQFFLSIISKEFENMYILYAILHTHALTQSRETGPRCTRRLHESCIRWAMQSVARVAILWTSRVPEQRANSATSGLVSPRSIFCLWRLLDRDECNIRSRAGFSDVEAPSSIERGSPCCALWWGWHVRDCASQREGRKEGYRMGWVNFTRGWRERCPRLAARCN